MEQFQQHVAQSQPRSRDRRWMWLMVALSLAVVGCGAKAYESRLAQTRDYFAYVDTVNQLLQPAPGWRSASVQEFRVPKPFRLIPPPADSNDYDARQPDYINGALPGLEGAWEAELDIDTANEPTTRRAFIYVLSNYSMLTSDNEQTVIEAPKFHEEAMRALTSGLRVVLDESSWHEERFPAQPGYVAQKAYQAVTFKPERPIQGGSTEFQVYLHQAGDVRVVVIFMIPDGVDRNVKLHEKIPYSLETLSVSGQITRPSAGGGSGGGGGKSSSSINF